MAGIREDATPHSARHTFASVLLTKGVDIPTVQKLGGWSNPDTLLKIYAETNTKQTTKAMKLLHREQAF